MHVAALLAEALELVRQLDYQIREENLEGGGGGHCSFSGKKFLLLDITQSPREQLTDALDALRCEPAVRDCTLSPELSAMLMGAKRAA